MIKLEEYEGVTVLRDDLLPGGTKSILMPFLTAEGEHFVYATPVYGAFQIALSIYCQQSNKKATIICAGRKETHPNTQICKDHGADVIEVKPGYLSCVEKFARDYAKTKGAVKLEFGAKTPQSIVLIAERMEEIIKLLGYEPDDIYCAVGSGTLAEGILTGTRTATVHGVCVGANYDNAHPRFKKYVYHTKFESLAYIKSRYFPSMPNYDLKAWQYCLETKDPSRKTLFWNVY